MTEAIVRLTPLDELARRWGEIEPLLAKATSRTGCYEPVDLLQMAMTGRAGIWVAETDGVIDAAIQTEVRQYPRKRVLEVPHIGGSHMRRWYRPLIAALDAHARELGCCCIAGSERRGWARVGGFREAGVILVRDL